jgi:hypothetical protein
MARIVYTFQPGAGGVKINLRSKLFVRGGGPSRYSDNRIRAAFASCARECLSSVQTAIACGEYVHIRAWMLDDD